MRTGSGLQEYTYEFAPNTPWRSSWRYEYICPEHLFVYDIPTLQAADIFIIRNYFDDPLYDLTGVNETNNYHTSNKLYSILAAPFNVATGAKLVDTTNRILSWVTNIAVYGDTIFAERTYKNRVDWLLVDAGIAVGNRKTLVNLETDDTITGFGDWSNNGPVADTNENGIPVVNHIREKSNLYGGTDENALANTVYMFAGHYQEVDAAFKANILSGGNYIVKNIDVFGGDCFITVFDYCHIMKDNFGGGGGFSYSIMIPLQSCVNVSMRQGRHITKDRSYEVNGGFTYNAGNGIGYTIDSATNMRWEDFNYNDAYSTTRLIEYPALPANYFSQGRFDMRERHSTIKIPGETIDNFRIFLINNFRDVDTWAGQINNVRNKAGRLYYWQDRAVGYMPINEKTLITDPLGGQVVLGVGGEFTSFEQGVDFYGNQHQWGLVDVEDGFCWVDFRRRVFIHMTTSFGITEQSIKKGINSLLHLDTLNPLERYDNCITNGILCGFDAEYRNVYITVKLDTRQYEGGTYNNTVIYDTLSQKFIGEWNRTPTLYISANAFFYSAMGVVEGDLVLFHVYSVGDQVVYNTDNYICILAFTYMGTPPVSDATHWAKINSLSDVWLHNHNDRGKFYGYVSDSVIEVVMNKYATIAKVADNIVLQGNDYGFTTLQARTVDQSVTESITDNNNAVVNRNYRYVKKAWYSSLPLYGRERLQGDWIAMRFTFDNRTAALNPTISRDKEIRFSILKTIWRKFF